MPSSAGSPRPGSAETFPVGRVKSQKSAALKEIEAWATAGRSSSVNDFARHSGQLMDNVTEQRMLIAKLREMSKERYKFLAQNEYDRKMFLERQQRKSSALKEMLEGVTTAGKRKAWGEEAVRRRANSHNTEITGPNARLVFLDRMDPTKAKDRHRDMDRRSDISRVDCTNWRKPPSTSSQVSTMPPIHCKQNTDSVVFPAEPSTIKRLKSAKDSVTNDEYPIRNPTPKSGRAVNFSNFRDLRRPAASTKKSTSSTSSTGPSYDHRYMELTSTLCQAYQTKHTVPEVSYLVQHMNALHVPPKKYKEGGRPKLKAVRIQDFMKENGLFLNY